MPLNPISVPTYPNVPNLPGVPALLRSTLTTVPSTVSALLGDGPAIGSLLQGTQWGIFTKNGGAVLLGDSVVSMEMMIEYRLADYPIEQGGFETYNKVATPYDARFQIARSGTEADRAQFLNVLQRVAKSLDLYTVTTPEKTYLNANIVHTDYRRTAKNGATLITADVWLREVRVAAAPAFDNTQSASAAGTQDDGNVPPFDASLPGLPPRPI